MSKAKRRKTLNSKLNIPEKFFLKNHKNPSKNRDSNIRRMINELRERGTVFSDSNLDIDGIYKEVLTKTPYKIPESYTQWSELAQIITTAIVNFVLISELPVLQETGTKTDFITTYNYAKLAKEWWASSSPLFIVDENLLNAILQSNFIDDYIDVSFVNKLLQNISRIYPYILFLFPKSSVFDGKIDQIDHCFVSSDISRIIYTFEGDDKPTVGELNVQSEGIFWGCLAKNNDVIADHMSVAREDNPYFKIMASCHSENLAEVAIQCLLLLSSKPNLFIEMSENEINLINKKHNKGFFVANKNAVKAKVIYPRLLNLDYAESKIRDDDKNTIRSGKEIAGVGTPKRPHWRLGYEANRPVGKIKGVPREQREYKMVKVAPYFVVGNSTPNHSNSV
ncbi:hypothetical protein [Planktothrix agardhii]|uniref:hypothetical protein n=1 Tax=Planktothrix agardhii TaxID=1160 RepID=UPI0033422DD3